MGKDIYIVDGLRTPIGRSYCGLKKFTAAQLAAKVIPSLLNRNKFEKDKLDQVIIGNAVAAGQGQNLARQATVLAQLPVTVPAITINNACGSGLQSVILAAQAIRSGDANIILAGGSESVSQSPEIIFINKKAQNDISKESMVHDGLWCHLTRKHMGMLSELLADEFKISREQQDQYALRSYLRAKKAVKEDKFKNEIVPIQIGRTKVLQKDERVDSPINIEKLRDLPGAFKEKGTVTAGNSCAPCDGAGMVLVSSREFAEKNKFKPKAKILNYASIAVEPEKTFIAGINAIRQCLDKGSLNINDIDLFEIGESFASQAILTQRTLKIPEEKINIFGGDIALGHPLGAAGARILITLIYALAEQRKKRGLACVCLGGGGAVAVAIETVED